MKKLLLLLALIMIQEPTLSQSFDLESPITETADQIKLDHILINPENKRFEANIQLFDTNGQLINRQSIIMSDTEYDTISPDITILIRSILDNHFNISD